MSNGKMFEVGSVTLSQIQFFYMTYCIFLQVFSYPDWPFSPQNSYNNFTRYHLNISMDQQGEFAIQELLKSVIISYILISLMFDSGVILLREIWF